MADLRLRINELPEELAPAPIDNIAIDGPATRRTTLQLAADAVRPYSTEAMAREGLNNTTAMTPLRVSQAIETLGGQRFATSQQGDRADSAVQPTRTISAGAGLTGGGTLAANREIALNSASIASLSLANSAVQPARQVIAGIGLTGGGSLAADRTVSLSSESQASLSKADSAIQAPGGTAGQVLVKASTAPGDVGWETIEGATAVSYGPQSLTAGQQGQARANIGADLLAGFRSPVVNGDYDVWQEATTQTTSGYGSADCWTFLHAESSKTVTRVAFANGQSDVPGDPQYFCRVAFTSAGTSTCFVYSRQPIENVNRFNGERATLTFYAKANAALKLKTSLTQFFGVGGSPSTAVENIGATLLNLSTGWQRFDVAINIPSTSGKIIGTSHPGYLGLDFLMDAGSSIDGSAASPGNQSGTIDIAHVSLVLGDATAESNPFPPIPLSEVLRLCHRYYWQDGVIINTSSAPTSIFFGQHLRTAPTISGGGAGFVLVWTNQSNICCYQTALANQTIKADARL